MLERLRAWVLKMLRVPAEPRAPEGTSGSTLVFRPGRNFYRLQLVRWGLANAGAAAGLVTAYYFSWRWVAMGPWWAQYLYLAAEVAAVLVLTVGLPFTFLALKWEYELRWYMVTDRSLRIRRGVWNVDELTMTFANIQEIRVKSGPLQNALGIADVAVHSAGGAGGGDAEGDAHAAAFEGVDNAAQIRDLMVKRLRLYRDLGLGVEAETTAVAEDASLAGARAVLDEARALRAALEVQA